MPILEIQQENTSCQESKATKGTNELFLKAVSVWINKPHVVNRRLCGSTIVQAFRCSSQTEVDEALKESRLSREKREEVSLGSEDLFKDLSDEQEPYLVLERELIPKSEFFPRLYEAIVFDKEKASVTFIPLDQSTEENGHAVTPTEELRYCIKLQKIDGDFPAWAQINEIVLSWTRDETTTEAPRRQVTSQWLCSVLLGKLVSWSQVNDISTAATSLQLVPVDRYKDTYVRLKNAYGRDLVKNWTERTDPEKFVYEDVAIAAYLLLIWEDDRKRKGLTKKQTFVDLGCGNGLLVYILTKEGHKGLGIDLRRRKIWDSFGPDIDLKEQIIKPSADNLFPDFDWLLGNHSDELTPWIPVLAARSSYNCSFFVLPCCHHDFVGKFGECKKGQSRYGTYIDYVKEIVTYCGFQPEVDTLRIPSTKRISIIGRSRLYQPDMEAEADARRQSFIDKRTSQNLKTPTAELTAESEVESPVFWVPSGKYTGSESQTDSGISSLDDTRLGSLSPSVLSSLSLDSEVLSVSVTPEIASPDINPMLPKRIKLDPDAKLSKSQAITPSSVLKACETVVGGRRQRLPSGSAFSDEASCAPELQRSVSDPAKKKWVNGFQPRSDPGIRNCQAVNEETKQKIVNDVFKLVLNAEGGLKVILNDGKFWTKGGSASLSEVADLVDKHTLQELKSECGGLQTLLRNHSHVFQVSGGRVMLRDFSSADPWKGCNPHKRQAQRQKAQSADKGPQKQKSDTLKTTLCFFHDNHPDGCPRSSLECLFAHGESELRPKPDRR